MTDSDMNAQPVEAEFIVPHRYPVWLMAFTAVVIAAAIYAMFLVPRYYVAASLLDKATEVDEAGNHAEALDSLAKADDRISGSKKIRLQAAYVLFEMPDEASHEKAMALLGGVTMNADEWTKIRTVMPEEDRSHFQSTTEH